MATKHLHLLGIGGTFMAGIATIARQLGFVVTGQDEAVYPPTSTLLAQQGIEVIPGYQMPASNFSPDLVIIGNVCSRGFPVVEQVLNQRIPYISAPQWLYETVLASKRVLAVSGTHGKTSTSSMLAWILTQLDYKPSYLIGGRAHNFDTMALCTSSPWFVIEADEYDTAFFDKRPKFMHYRPEVLAINNIEFDHADIYSNLAAIEQQFIWLLRSVPSTGALVTPFGDAVIERVVDHSTCIPKRLMVGAGAADFTAAVEPHTVGHFEVFFHQDSQGMVEWSLFGAHNIANALIAIAIASHIGIDPQHAVKALASFKGVARRNEHVATINGADIYNDFAHHPTAIYTTLCAFRRKRPNDKIWAVVELASNTMRQGACDYNALCDALNLADKVLLLKPASSAFNISRISDVLQEKINIFESSESIEKVLRQQLRSDHCAVVMSNSSFGGLCGRLAG